MSHGAPAINSVHRLYARRRLAARLWLGAACYLLVALPLYVAFRTHALAVALPLFTLGAFFVAGAGPPFDAVRVDVVVPRLRGRAEAIRQVLRTAAEAGVPALFGVLAAVLAGGGTAGLGLAFLLGMARIARCTASGDPEHGGNSRDKRPAREAAFVERVGNDAGGDACGHLGQPCKPTAGTRPGEARYAN